MKKIFISVIAMMTLFVSSCSDMLEVDSGRGVDSPELGQASDSLFYFLGILQAVQQAGDTYVLQNEMRGDLTNVTVNTDMNLRQLADFSATASNKYDSAYVYYRIINNCNYYIAHRDTTIMDGTYNVVRNEYAAVLSYRAWAYLQLVRTYGSVKFITEPLQNLSDIENNNAPELGLEEIVARLADDGGQALRRFSGCDIPYGDYSIGSANFVSKMCIPVDLMLGELYLEAGRYAEAADYYFKFLLNNRLVSTNQRSAVDYGVFNSIGRPADFPMTETDSECEWYLDNFNTYTSVTSNNGRVTYVPFADNSSQGVTSQLPLYFGYDPYKVTDGDVITEEQVRELLTDIQIVPSAAYKHLADSSIYYYTSSGDASHISKGQLTIGDQRDYERFSQILPSDTTRYLDLYQMPQVVLYRGTTVWLHLAEAFNRMGHPDLAFAILKDGITTDLLSDVTYISEESKNLLVTRYPFCIGEGASIFSASLTERNFGIHAHGCGDQWGTAGTTSLYQMASEVSRKLSEIDNMFGFSSSTAGSEDSLAVLVNAVEDLLCDEYAMEFAFEGTRYADLMRLARHKNESSPASYGTNFGGRWLARKLAYKNPVKNLEDESNWYLPMK